MDYSNKNKPMKKQEMGLLLWQVILCGGGGGSVWREEAEEWRELAEEAVSLKFFFFFLRLYCFFKL